MKHGFVEHRNNKTFGPEHDPATSEARRSRTASAAAAARSAVRRRATSARKARMWGALVVPVMALAMTGLTAPPASAAVAVTGWEGTITTSTVNDLGGNFHFSAVTTWSLDGVLAQDSDPFLFPNAASFVQLSTWTTQLQQRDVDVCETDGDGIVERYPWSRQATGTGTGTVRINYGAGDNPNAYSISPEPDGAISANYPAVTTPCTTHPAAVGETVTVSAPRPESANPVDTSGYRHIAGSDSSGAPTNTDSISWDLFRFPPTFAFSRATYSVLENQATATITVARDGDPRIPASVRYAAAAGTAAAGDDFTATSGVLRFAAGETTKSFTVAIVPDTVAEGPETIALRLSAPSKNATLVAPRTARLTIGASDQQPDALVSADATAGFVGDNVYNSTGAGQTRTLAAARGQARDFFVRVANDGNQTNTIAVRGSAARTGSSVAYFSGSTDVTATMRSAAGLRVTLAPGADSLIRVRIVALPDAVVGSLKPATVTGTWVGDGPHVDAARAVLKVSS